MSRRVIHASVPLKGEAMSDGIVWKVLPRSFRGALRDWVRQAARMTASQLLAGRYEPLRLTQQDAILVFDAKEFVRANTETRVGDIPVPDSTLRMGYGASPEEFLHMASKTASLLRAVMKERNVT